MVQPKVWRAATGVLRVLALAAAPGLSGCSGDDALPEVVPQPTFTPDEGRDTTDERLGQLSVALTRYVTRHNHRLPALTDIDSLQKDLAGYLNERPVGGEEIFSQAETGEKFATNAAVAGKNIYARGDGSAIMLIYQAHPSLNDTRPVVFGDGSYRRIGENEWPRIQQSSTNALRALKNPPPTPTNTPKADAPEPPENQKQSDAA